MKKRSLFLAVMAIAMTLFFTTPSNAQIISGWQASYFHNSDASFYDMEGRRALRDELNSSACYVLNRSGGFAHHPDPCWIPDSVKSKLIDTLIAMQTCPARIADTARMRVEMGSRSFFREAEIRGTLRADPGPINGSIARKLRFPLMGCRTRLDSILLVTNWVHRVYPYEEPNRDAPEDPDSTYRLLSTGHLWGQCGQYAHFWARIQEKLFPWWGNTIEVTSNSDPADGNCSVSHVFVGLIEDSASAIITYVVDPTVNGVWCDQQRHPLSLDSMKSSLWRGQAPVKKNSVFFGTYHAEPVLGFQENPQSVCEWDAMFNPRDSHDFEGSYSSGTRDTVIIWGPLKEFDYRDLLAGNPQQDYYWNQHNIPQTAWGWWCTALFIRQAGSVNASPALKAAVAQRYGFPVY